MENYRIYNSRNYCLRLELDLLLTEVAIYNSRNYCLRLER